MDNDNNKNSFQDYSAPEPYDPDVQYGFPSRNVAQTDQQTTQQQYTQQTDQQTVGQTAQSTGGYNLNGQYYQNSSGSYNAGTGNPNAAYGMPNDSGYHYGGGNYSSTARTVPLDRKGRPLRNRFGMKLTFSILGIVFGLIFMFLSPCYGLIPLVLSIIALVFTCMQNKHYKEGNWPVFQSTAKVSAVLLWVDLGVWVVILIFFIIAMIVLFSIGNDFFDELGLDDMNLPSSGYESDYGSDDKDDAPVKNDGEIHSLEGERVPDVEGFNQFTLQGETFTIPMSVDDFYEAGFYLQEDSQKENLEPENSNGYAYYDADGNYLGTLFVYNTTDRSIQVKDGMIGGITVNQIDGIDFQMVGGLTFDSSLKDAAAVLGTAVTDMDESGAYGYYQWYFENGGYATSVELDFDEDKMNEVWIMNYAELKD